ncbi:MAG: hypothetical protein WCJ02_15200 [bacterium]
MNKHLFVSLLAGTTSVLCGIAQDEPAQRQIIQRPALQNNAPGAQMNQQRPMQGGMGVQCPMHQQQGGMNQQCPMMRGPMSEVPGQMPLMRGMANQGRQTPGEPTPRRLFADPVALKEAGATDEQLLAFKTFMKEQRMKQIDLRASIQKAELALELLEAEPKSDEATLLKATDDISKAQAELLRQETLMKTKVKSIFGEEVVKKLFEANQKKQIQRPQIPQGQGERQGRQPQGNAPGAQAPSGPDAK